MTAFWDIGPCSLVRVDWRIRGAYCLSHQGSDAGSLFIAPAVKGWMTCFPKESFDYTETKLTPWRKNPKVYHRTHNSPPPIPVLRQSNPIHNPQANLPKINSDPIFPPMPWSSQWSLSFGLSHLNLVHISLLSHAVECIYSDVNNITEVETVFDCVI
jgi:hypothetical protein